MIEAIEKNLHRGITLLQNITDDQYTCKTTPPYFSSIGNHIRHILDIFSCILDGLENDRIDLTERERDQTAQEKTEAGIAYFYKIINRLQLISKQDLSQEIVLVDDIGLGKIQAKYTLAAALMQAQSHATHHYASIGYMIYQQQINLPDNAFGFNPTTPVNY